MSETAHEHPAELAVRLAQLERQVRRQRRFLSLFTLAAVVTLTAAFTTTGPFAAAGLHAARIDSLTVRRLVLVDTNNTPRAMLGAPLPDPIMLGKRFLRRGDVSGLMLYDSEGNERGGYVTGDSGRGAALTLDEINRAAVHLGVNERGEMHLTMSNGQGHWSGLGITPRGSYFQIGSAGKVVFDIADTGKRGDR